MLTEPPDEFAWMIRGRCRTADPARFVPADAIGVEIAQRVRAIVRCVRSGSVLSV